MKRKIAVLSGIHGNLPALETVLDELNKQKYEAIICLGDIVSYGPNPKECLELLKKNKVKILLGDAELKCLDRILLKKDEKDHFKWIKNKIGKKNLNYLKQCPISYDEIEVNGRNLYFTYYFLEDKTSPYPFSKKSILKNKNKWTDRKYLSKYIGKNNGSKILEDSNTFLVGSLGSSNDEYASYMIIEIDDQEVTTKRIRLLYNKDLLKIAIDKKDYPLKSYIKENIFFI